MNQDAKVVLGIGIATLVILVAGVFFVSKSTKPENQNQPVDQSMLIRPDSNKTVAANSKVTVVEFGDYQCPACGSVHPLIKQILNENKDTMTLVFRNFPLSQHANAQIAAEAAEAAGEQGKYWEMHDLLFEKQTDWAENKKPLDIFVSYAEALQLDVNKFKQAVNDKKFAAKIQADTNDGNAIGINSTPTFFIDGIKFTGDYASFKSLVESKTKQ